MNKQELIEKIKTLKPYEPDLYEYDSEELKRFEEGFSDAKIYAELAVKELDEQEKPVVPRCVADMIVKRKQHSSSLVTTLVTLGAFEDARKWIRKGDNGDIFAKAWLYGYEVEKDKLYTVEIPNPNGDGYGIVYLGRNEDNKIELRIWDCFSSIEFSNNWKQFDNAQLTESEIKEDFEWAFRWAKEVE